jgi:adenylyltransferase/sulfurtransferase
MSDPIREVSPDELRQMRERGAPVTCVDVREPNEWNLFRIPGALHLPLGKIEDAVESALALDAEVVVYCGRGNRSQTAAELMRRKGYTHVSSLAGGIMGWIGSGGEIEE